MTTSKPRAGIEIAPGSMIVGCRVAGSEGPSRRLRMRQSHFINNLLGVALGLGLGANIVILAHLAGCG